MTHNNQGNLPAIKAISQSPAMIKRLNDLSVDSASFMASVLSICTDNKQLVNCDANSIWAAAIKAAVLNLPIDKELGCAYLVPYKGQAQFQLGWRGFVQLALRSKEYKSIRATPVYTDEIDSYNPVSGEFTFVKGFKSTSERFTGGQPFGYYAKITLISGYEATGFMTYDQVENHAKKYSQAYKYDLSKRYKSSPWSTGRDAMGNKTVLKMLLKNYGPLSIEMQKALVSDNEDEVLPEIEDIPEAKVEVPKTQEVKQPIEDEERGF